MNCFPLILLFVAAFARLKECPAEYNKRTPFSLESATIKRTDVNGTYVIFMPVPREACHVTKDNEEHKLLHAIVGFGEGVIEAGEDMIHGIVDMAKHPIHFARNLTFVIQHPKTTAEAVAASIHHKCTNETPQCIGQIVGNVLILAVTMGADAAFVMPEYLQLASKTADIVHVGVAVNDAGYKGKQIQENGTLPISTPPPDVSKSRIATPAGVQTPPPYPEAPTFPANITLPL